MDKLKTIISLLDEEDKKEFAVFVQRQKKLKNRMDLVLFKLLASEKEVPRDEILQKLYKDEPNLSGYHALRKRLMQHLSAYILLKRTEEDGTTAAGVMGYISLASYLFEKNEVRLAWEFLRKAEKMAAEAEQYGLLNNIYLLQAEQSASEHSVPLAEITKKHLSNKLLAEENERLVFAQAQVSQKLNEAIRLGSAIDFDALVREALAGQQLTEAAQKRPAMVYRLIEISRSAILAKKDFYGFEPFVIGQFEKIEAEGGFGPHQGFVKMGFLYMISHVLYRNRKFEASLNYLDRLDEELVRYKKAHWRYFYPKSVLLKAACFSFLEKNADAAKLLSSLIEDKNLNLGSKDLLNAQLNLSFYYFQTGDFLKASKAFYQISHSEQWLEKQLGREWVMKRGISEVILQYELGNWDIAENRIRSIKRSFNDMLAAPRYANAKSFLALLSLAIENPEQLSKPEFIKAAQKTIDFAPIEREDLQAINFYAWLKAKMLKKGYYDMLGELVKREV